MRLILMSVLAVAGLALQVRAEPAVADCAKALQAGFNRMSTYNSTYEEGDWAKAYLAGADAAGPAPATCAPALAAPAQFTMYAAMQCQALFELDAAADPAAKGRLDALLPMVEERIVDEGHQPDEEFAVGWMERYRREAPQWEAGAAADYRQYCLKAQADYPVAKAWDDERDLIHPHKNKCLAVLQAEAEAGKWASLSKDERDWALDQEMHGLDSDLQPPGACLARWREGMTYDVAVKSVTQFAPRDEVLANLSGVKNAELVARTNALFNRGASTSGSRTVSASDTPAGPAPIGPWSTYPSRETLESMSVADAVKAISAVNTKDWRVMAMHWLYETTDVQEMMYLADQALYSEAVRDYKGAADLFARAADGGSPYAIYRLGRLYLNGLGVPQDEAYGEQLLAVAAGAGISDAQKELTQRQGRRDDARRAEMERQYWAGRAEVSRRKFDFFLQCGYSPPDDEHDWICVKD